MDYHWKMLPPLSNLLIIVSLGPGPCEVPIALLSREIPLNIPSTYLFDIYSPHRLSTTSRFSAHRVLSSQGHYSMFLFLVSIMW